MGEVESEIICNSNLLQVIPRQKMQLELARTIIEKYQTEIRYVTRKTHIWDLDTCTDRTVRCVLNESIVRFMHSDMIYWYQIRQKQFIVQKHVQQTKQISPFFCMVQQIRMVKHHPVSRFRNLILMVFYTIPLIGEQPLQAPSYTGKYKYRGNASIHLCPKWGSKPRSKFSNNRRQYMP